MIKIQTLKDLRPDQRAIAESRPNPVANSPPRRHGVALPLQGEGCRAPGAAGWGYALPPNPAPRKTPLSNPCKGLCGRGAGGEVL